MTMVKTMLSKLMVVAALAATLAFMLAPAMASVAEKATFRQRDKTGTTWGPRNSVAAEVLRSEQLAATFSFAAEGTGVEPATPCGAPHFQCGR